MTAPRPAPILSDAAIAGALRRAERGGCEPGAPRCYGFPFSVEDALRSLTPGGRCRVGWVAGRGGRGDRDVRFRADTGAVRTAREGAGPLA